MVGSRDGRAEAWLAEWRSSNCATSLILAGEPQGLSDGMHGRPAIQANSAHNIFAVTWSQKKRLPSCLPSVVHRGNRGESMERARRPKALWYGAQIVPMRHVLPTRSTFHKTAYCTAEIATVAAACLELGIIREGQVIHDARSSGGCEMSIFLFVRLRGSLPGPVSPASLLA